MNRWASASLACAATTTAAFFSVVALASADSPPAPVATADNRTACVAVVHTARGRNCNSGGSLEVRIQNTCGDMIKMSLCLHRDNGAWSCFSESRATHGASVSGHVCNAGSQGYRYRACDVGESCRADN